MKTIVKNRRRGRRVEKQIAKKLETIPIGIFGKHDLETKKFIIEVKSRLRYSFEKFFNQLHKNNKNNKIEILILHKKHGKIDNSFVVLKFKDFQDIINGKM